MHAKRIPLAVAALGAALLGGCAFVQVTPEGERVQITDATGVHGCERVARTQVTVAHRIGFVQRSADRVADELDTMARNAAADAGGNTVVRISDIEGGRASYAIYDCPR